MVGHLNRPQSEGERFLGALKEAGPQLHDTFNAAMKPRRDAEKAEAENARLEQLTGRNYRGLSPDIKELLLKGEQAKKGAGGVDHSQAMGAIGEMEKMIDSKGIGMMGNMLNFSSEARYNRGKFESLQAAIMPVFKGLFPRGMTEKEFKFVNEHYIPQAGDTEEKIRGKIAGLKQLMANGDMGNPQQAMNMMGDEQGGGEGDGEMVVFRDAKGNIYDIPAADAKKHAARLEAQGLTRE